MSDWQPDRRGYLYKAVGSKWLLERPPHDRYCLVLERSASEEWKTIYASTDPDDAEKYVNRLCYHRVMAWGREGQG